MNFYKELKKVYRANCEVFEVFDYEGTYSLYRGFFDLDIPYLKYVEAMGEAFNVFFNNPERVTMVYICHFSSLVEQGLKFGGSQMPLNLKAIKQFRDSLLSDWYYYGDKFLFKNLKNNLIKSVKFCYNIYITKNN